MVNEMMPIYHKDACQDICSMGRRQRVEGDEVEERGEPRVIRC